MIGSILGKFIGGKAKREAAKTDRNTEVMVKTTNKSQTRKEYGR